MIVSLNESIKVLTDILKMAERGMNHTFTSMQGYLSQLGIRVMSTDGKYRAAESIVADLRNCWDDLPQLRSVSAQELISTVLYNERKHTTLGLILFAYEFGKDYDILALSNVLKRFCHFIEDAGGSNALESIDALYGMDKNSGMDWIREKFFEYVLNEYDDTELHTAITKIERVSKPEISMMLDDYSFDPDIFYQNNDE